jgi:selenocysteine lyase/cysteine desulfurase
MDRRHFLLHAGAAAAIAACALPVETRPPRSTRRDEPSLLPFDPRDWESVRAQFAIANRPIDLSALYISSHPAPVRAAIAQHREALDRQPTLYLLRNERRLTHTSIDAAALFLGADPDDIALTDSTTMSLGILYNGIRLTAGQELVTTEHDYYVTHEALRQASERTGAIVRKIALYDRIEDVSEQQIVNRIIAAVGPRTRVLALTWVHSGTGLKLPLAEIGAAVREVNVNREEGDRVLVCVDGVHGLGVEDATVDDLGCDFFAAGAHKWLFGPRGTGVLWGRGVRWEAVRPLVPSFLDDASWAAWIRGGDLTGPPDGKRMTPGGFKPYEHRWAMAAAFEFLDRIGKRRVRDRTHELAAQLKEGLAAMPRVRLITPRDERLSSGIVCCDIEGRSPFAAVSALLERGFVATVTPYAVEYLRFAPSIRNTPEEIDAALGAVRELA